MRELIELVEARRWQKPGLADVVARYAADPMVFVHFTPAKVGINPRYSHDHTPAGIYAYPIAVLLNGDTPKRHIPHLYASESRFMFFLRVKPGAQVIEVSDYDAARLHADREALGRRFGQAAVDAAAQQLEGTLSPFETLYRLTRALVEHPPSGFGQPSRTAAVWAGTLRRLGYDGLIDRGDYAITRDIARQAVFFTKAAIAVIDMWDNR